VLVIVGSTVYLRDISHSCEQARQNGNPVTSSYRYIEYTQDGGGPAVLVIQRTGDGYDQNQLIIDAALGEESH
jgi:hypothetical protein